MVPVVFCTLPPLEIVKLLLAPDWPTMRVLEFDQRELLPVTSTELFEEVEALPMVPVVFCTLPPLEITRLLPAPLLPTKKVVLLQRELVSVTSTELFEEVEAFPMYPKVFCTLPPLEIVKLLLAPLMPTVRVVLLVQRELVPVTSTELFVEVEAFPMIAWVFCTLPPLEITRLLPAPLLPT